MRDAFLLDPSITFLNHGSFGAAPREVLAFQRELQEELEREPVQFFLRRLEPLLDETRAKVAGFVGADAEDLVFVRNATMGVNSVLRSLEFREGDELLTTNQEYNASANALRYVAELVGAKVVVADLPFPLSSPQEVVEAVLARVTDKTKLLLIDHVTSPTALVLPVAQIVAALNERGIDTLVDGAHAPGMVPLDLNSLGAAYFTGNCHKWICAPKGAAILWVRRDRQHLIRPTSISHGANSPRTDRSRYLIEFDWLGTDDFSSAISIGKALDVLPSIAGTDWVGVMKRNRDLALAAQKHISGVLGIPLPAPAEMIGSMAAFPLPDPKEAVEWSWPYLEPLQDELFTKHQIEVPLFPWPVPPKRLIRVSAQIYNEMADYERLGGVLPGLLDS